MNFSHKQLRCGIVLAAGEGERLKPYVHRLRGDALPKQYVSFTGTRSMLEHTFSRAERVIAPEGLFTIVSRDHLRHPEVRRQLSSRPGHTIVVQPQNRETAPGVLLPLMHLYKRYPDAAVVVFPSDHFVLEEELFMTYVDLAFRVVERHPAYLILLGMVPAEPEPDYGYVLPGARMSSLGPLGIREVLCFVEKPRAELARQLAQEGGLWNTMVMVFKIQTLLELVRTIAPRLCRRFRQVFEAIGQPDETRVVEEIYRNMEAVNFSRGLLEPFSVSHAPSLLVLSVQGVLWSDWGSERRVSRVLSQVVQERPQAVLQPHVPRSPGREAA